MFDIENVPSVLVMLPRENFGIKTFANGIVSPVSKSYTNPDIPKFFGVDGLKTMNWDFSCFQIKLVLDKILSRAKP